MTNDEFWKSLSHRGVGLMPYGPEAEAQTLQALRAGGFAPSLEYIKTQKDSLIRQLKFEIRPSLGRAGVFGGTVAVH